MREGVMWIKIAIVSILVFVLFQLFYALTKMVKATKTDKNAMVRALMFRVIGSLLIFIIILVAYSLGFLKPSSHLSYSG